MADSTSRQASDRCAVQQMREYRAGWFRCCHSLLPKLDYKMQDSRSSTCQVGHLGRIDHRGKRNGTASRSRTSRDESLGRSNSLGDSECYVVHTVPSGRCPAGSRLTDEENGVRKQWISHRQGCNRRIACPCRRFRYEGHQSAAFLSAMSHLIRRLNWPCACSGSTKGTRGPSVSLGRLPCYLVAHLAFTHRIIDVRQSPLTDDVRPVSHVSSSRNTRRPSASAIGLWAATGVPQHSEVLCQTIGGHEYRACTQTRMNRQRSWIL